MSIELVKYGGYTLSDAKVTIQQSFVHDSDDRTLLGAEYVITVTGWITGGSIPDLQDKIVTMRRYLGKSQQRLTIHDQSLGEATAILDLDPQSFLNTTAVHDFGPTVIGLQISEISGLMSARYSWQVKAFRKDCTGNPSPILSIQRTYAFSIDVAGYATRSVSGTMKVTKQGVPVDQYRSMVTPGLPSRFRRIQAQYSPSPDGRSLTFNIVDQEVYRTLPTHIADGEATWSVRVADMGARVFYALNGRFKGGPDTSKPAMLQSLLNLISSRFPLSDPSLIFEDASIDDSVYGNEFTFSVVASGVIGTLTNSTQIFNSVFKGMLTPPPESNDLSYLPGPYGAMPGVISHVGKTQILSDSCAVPFGEQTGTAGFNVKEYETGTTIQADGDPYQVAQDGVSPQHLATPFMEFKETVNISFDYGLIVYYPKDAMGEVAAGPEFVRPRRPSVNLTQVGYYVVLAKSKKDVPVPPQVIDGSFKLKYAEVKSDNPEPVADGVWKRWKVQWMYVGINDYYVISGDPYGHSADAFVQIPDDARIIGKDPTPPFNGKMPWLNPPGVPQ